MSNSALNFNLLPPKTKEEIVAIDERDNSVLYSAFLVFFAVIIFSVFTVGKALLIDTRQSYLEDVISKQDTKISSYSSIRQVNGELFVKSNALAPIVEQDIKLSELLDVASKLIEGDSSILITNYARLLEGTFEVTFEMKNYSDINKISANSLKIDTLKEFFIKSLTKNTAGGAITAIVSFNLTNIT